MHMEISQHCNGIYRILILIINCYSSLNICEFRSPQDLYHLLQMEQWGSRVTKKNQTLTNTVSTASQEIMLIYSKGRNFYIFHAPEARLYWKHSEVSQMHFLCNNFYSNLVFSGKKIKNWGHLLNTKAGSFVLLVSHRNPLPGRVQAQECQRCSAKMGQCELTWTRGRGKWAQNSSWHISINKELNPRPFPQMLKGLL